MIGKLAMVALVGMVLGACGSTHGEASQGQTHWLSACEEDADCGDALSCACGTCVALCDARGGCDTEGRETSCLPGSSTPVQAMCTPDNAPALCLEACDGECESGQRCVGGACVSEIASNGSAGEGGEGGDEPSAGQGGGSGAGAGGLVTGGEGGGAGTGDTPDASVMTAFTLGVANVGEKAVVVETAGCSGRPSWFSLSIGGEPLRLFGGCACANADDEGFCPTPPPVCGEPEYATIQPGEEMAFWTWDLAQWPEPAGSCGDKIAIDPETEVAMEVCWLDMVPEEPFGEPATPTCATRTFVPDKEAGYSFVISAP